MHVSSDPRQRDSSAMQLASSPAPHAVQAELAGHRQGGGKEEVGETGLQQRQPEIPPGTNTSSTSSSCKLTSRQAFVQTAQLHFRL